MFMPSLYPNYKCIHEHNQLHTFFLSQGMRVSSSTWEIISRASLILVSSFQFCDHLHFFFCITELPILFSSPFLSPTSLGSSLSSLSPWPNFFQIHCNPFSTHHCAKTIIILMNDNFYIGTSSEYVLSGLYQVFLLYLTLLITLS